MGMLVLLAANVRIGSKVGHSSGMALYTAALVVVNCWLLRYTWLQHTDVDVPHLADEAFTFAAPFNDRPTVRLHSRPPAP